MAKKSWFKVVGLKESEGTFKFYKTFVKAGNEWEAKIKVLNKNPNVNFLNLQVVKVRKRLKI